MIVHLSVICVIIGKLGYIDRTTPDPRWASKNPCTTPKGEGRDFSDDPARIGGSSGQCYLVLLLLYPLIMDL